MHLWKVFMWMCGATCIFQKSWWDSSSLWWFSCTFCKASFPSRRLAEDCGTADTQYYSLRVAEHCSDLVAACEHTHTDHWTGQPWHLRKQLTFYNQMFSSLLTCPCSCLYKWVTWNSFIKKQSQVSLYALFDTPIIKETMKGQHIKANILNASLMWVSI